MTFKMDLNSHTFLPLASVRHPPVVGETEWYSGDTTPAREGWYDRCFTDGVLRHWWDGKEFWWASAGRKHWHQVGSYPCWRGSTTRHIPDPTIISWSNNGRCLISYDGKIHTYVLEKPRVNSTTTNAY